MPYRLDDGDTYIDLCELGGPLGGDTLVPGLSRDTIRRLTRDERWPPPVTRRPRMSWRLEDVAAAMRDLAMSLPRAWGLPAEGAGGLDLRAWAARLPAETPLRASAILTRWLADGGALVRPLDLGRGLAALCQDGGPLCRWRSDGGWLYLRGVRPATGRRAAHRRR